VEFAATTHYHWSNFDGNATQKGEHEIVQGPFQFGLADKLDKTNKEVSVKLNNLVKTLEVKRVFFSGLLWWLLW
jgi:hypothetical protein